MAVHFTINVKVGDYDVIKSIFIALNKQICFIKLTTQRTSLIFNLNFDLAQKQELKVGLFNDPKRSQAYPKANISYTNMRYLILSYNTQYYTKQYGIKHINSRTNSK
jgi:hypothetical protein